jgi:diguanylate cyclase (GGDEF)-like protein
MPSGDQLQPVGDEPEDRASLKARTELLERRLARERSARQEAETISERATRELYDKQQGLVLLEQVVKAANEAAHVQDAIMSALQAVCRHSQWPLGHAWLTNDEQALVSTGLWISDDPNGRFDPFRSASEGARYVSGEGLPGRVMAEAGPVWLSDLETASSLPRLKAAQQAGLETAMGFPILVGSEVVGVLEFLSERRLEPNEDLVGLMAQVGTHLGRVVERERAAQTLRHQATHDALTGLPNRVLLLDELQRALSRQRRRPGELTAVFFLDLDGFKSVNDTLGHAAGDRVLRDVAQRLLGVIRPHDTLGRLSGDEFVIVCESLESEFPIATIADRLSEALLAPFELDGEQFLVSASVGIVLTETGDEPSQLIQQADAAMYRAKELGRGRYEIFSDELRERISRRLETERALRGAVARSEMVLHYQPQVDLSTGAIAGVEALLRWERPEGMVMPNDFVPMAEETGLIVPIGAWVLREAVDQSWTWQSDADIVEAPWTSVNLSVRQLSDPDLMASVAKVLSDHSSDPSKLFLEVTESLILEDAEQGLTVLTALKALGTEIAIDDFGTGYASLSYLRRFPATILKVDRSFIAAINDDHRTRAIVTAIIEMAHALGLQTVAEGIETVEQLTTVRELGCDLGQGFLFARPMPAVDLAPLLRERLPFASMLA